MKEKSTTRKGGSKTKLRDRNTSRVLAKREQIKARRRAEKKARKELALKAEEARKLSGMTDAWEGRKVAVLASGPSLIRGDALLVRNSGFITIVVNNAWEVAPWYDVLYAGDTRWWKVYGDTVEGNGKRVSRSSYAHKRYGAKVARTHLGPDYNSGELAIEYACLKKPKLIVLLGFDCSIANGLHFHGPHQRTPNPNKSRCLRWKEQFERIPKKYPDAPIVNCSRYTELDCFPQADLMDVL